ncbi:DUF6318 family protein [Nocardioides kribbensis]|uniref:DUF6318 family protein n=1 Tax=Nocardioides kribbensis TaxID=305517 RepID=A0ABV1P1Z8_9ACTN
MKPSALVAAAMTVSLLSIAGCSDDPEPEIASPTAAPSPLQSSTAPTEPTATAPPAAAPEGESRKAAMAAVRHYFDLVNYATATGDIDPLRASTAPNCAACSGGAEALDQIYAQDGEIDGGVATLERASARTVKIGDDVRYLVEADVTTEPQVVTYPEGEVDRYPGGTVSYQFFLEPFENGLRILDWNETPS